MDDRLDGSDPSLLGYAMAAYFGGRAECRIRKVPLPVVYLDFLSMYPTVNALMDSWELVTAQRMVVDDVTEEARRLLASGDLAERFFDPGLWPQLRCLVEVEPDGEIFPVRAKYDRAGLDYGIGVNPFRSPGTAWYTLPDVVAATILSGRAPTVVRAIRFRGVRRQGGLRSVRLRGAVDIDPRHEDAFRRVIELRHQVRGDKSLPPEERDRLEGFLKVLANATGYGIYAEMTRQEKPNPVEVTVYADRDEPFACSTTAPEEPGRYSYPPLAALSTGGARLMLALLEHEVTKVGGAYVFCDTDSMAIVSDRRGGPRPCPGGGDQLPNGRQGVKAVSWSQVDRIVERFAALNPYDPTFVPGSVLKVEEENFEDGRRRQLWCFAISAKRYVFSTVDLSAIGSTLDATHLLKPSAHGLGHLLNPLDPDDPSEDWVAEAWVYALRNELGLGGVEPGWLDRPALTRVTASGPNVLRWFAGMNEERSYAEQIKPANFLLLAHPDPMEAPEALPIAPYKVDPSKWMDMPWLDRRTGESIRITTERWDGSERVGAVRVQTYCDVLHAYAGHPESKSLAPDGGPVLRNTIGLLRRRPVEAAPPLVCIGKEANKLDDRLSGFALGPEDYLEEYIDPARDVWSLLVVPVLAMMKKTELAERVGVHRRTIERYLTGRMRPHAGHEQRLSELAVEHAQASHAASGGEGPHSTLVVLHRYLQGQVTEKGGPPVGGTGHIEHQVLI